jgi:hypothetical protein
LDFAGDACVAAGSAAGCCADWTGTGDVADEESEEQAGEKGDMHCHWTVNGTALQLATGIDGRTVDS